MSLQAVSLVSVYSRRLPQQRRPTIVCLLLAAADIVLGVVGVVGVVGLSGLTLD